MIARTALAATLACSMAASATVETANWNNWRGPLGTGYAPDASPPTHWSETENIRWKTPIPGRSYSSPVVFGDRVYVMTAIETDQVSDEPMRERTTGRHGPGADPPVHVYRFEVMALDRETGKVLWRTLAREERPHEGVHPTATHSNAAPIVDEDRVYAFFGSRGLYALDHDGEVLWSNDLGDMETGLSWGEGQTPALAGGTIVVPWDHELDSFVIGLDAATGKEKWRVPRNEGTSWASPTIASVGGRTQAVVAGLRFSAGYDVETGEEIWRCKGLTPGVLPSPVIGNGMVYLMTGYQRSMVLAIDLAKAEGDISGSDAIVWTYNRAAPFVPSPMLAGERLYYLNKNNGAISCIDALTGDQHYVAKRLSTIRDVYASVVGGGKHVYVCGRDGDVAVLEDGDEFNEVAVNDLGEGVNATPAIAGGELFLRTDSFLYCISEGAFGD